VAKATVVLHKVGVTTGLMVSEFKIPFASDEFWTGPTTLESIFLVCWNGVWCSPHTHRALRPALAELRALERLDAFVQAPTPTSSMARPPWQDEHAWRRLRPMLHIAGVLTIPTIPGQRTRGEFRSMVESKRSPDRPLRRSRGAPIRAPNPSTLPLL
jgi:hypothetical protein